MNAGGSASGDSQVFRGLKIVADVFAGMGYRRQNRIGRKSLHFEHDAFYCARIAHNLFLAEY
jgi:hypothetical protein